LAKKYKNIFPMEIFIGQIKKIMTEKNLKSGAEFDREAGLENMAARWFNPKWRGKSVDTDTLLTIAKSFNKSLDWLVFGEEPLLAVEETKAVYEARPLDQRQDELLHQTLKVIEEVLQQGKRPIRPDQKSRLIGRIFNDCAEDRSTPNPNIVKRYIAMLD